MCVRGVDCGAGAFCRSSTSGNGYECVCDEAHIDNVTQNDVASCTERTCSNLGFDSCGDNAQCTDTSYGITCSCTSGAFVGLTVANAPASCSESGCTNSNCPEGSSCVEDDTTGYMCKCNDEYVPANRSNGAPLICVPRTCSNPGFSETSASSNLSLIHI